MERSTGLLMDLQYVCGEDKCYPFLFLNCKPSMLNIKLASMICTPVPKAILPPNTRRILLLKPICSKFGERKIALIINMIPITKIEKPANKPFSRLMYLNRLKKLGAMGNSLVSNAYTLVMVANEIMLIPKNIKVPVAIKVWKSI